MKSNRLLWALTLVNFGLLVYQVVPLRTAQAQTETPMLRGRGLEIVDDQGRVRAQMKLEPVNTTFKWPDGRVGFPETMIFRLITADGKPRVKLTTSEEGCALMLLGDSDTTHVLLKAEGAATSLKLRNNETTERVLAP